MTTEKDLSTDVVNVQKNGKISFANDVVATIAGLAASDVAGVAGMSGGVKDGIVDLLGRKNLTKGIKVEVGNEEAAIDVYIVVNYGAKIHEVAQNVQAAVVKAIETMTGLKVVEVNVNVQGVIFEKEVKLEEPQRVR